MASIEKKKQFLAELVGTFILVFLGTSAVVAVKLTTGSVPWGVPQFLGIGIVFGVALMVAAYTVGPISGAHLNPAVTLGMRLSGRIAKDQVIPYIVAQCVGALMASLALYALLGTMEHGLGETTIGAYGLREALGVEVALTGLLVFTVLGVTDKGAPAGLGGLVIGIYLAASHVVGIPFSGNSLNPARSLGPAVLVGGPALEQLFLTYIVAPFLGAILAAGVYRWVKSGGRLQ